MTQQPKAILPFTVGLIFRDSPATGKPMVVWIHGNDEEGKPNVQGGDTKFEWMYLVSYGSRRNKEKEKDEGNEQSSPVPE